MASPKFSGVGLIVSPETDPVLLQNDAYLKITGHPWVL